jgi:hypothetical protein
VGERRVLVLAVAVLVIVVAALLAPSGGSAPGASLGKALASVWTDVAVSRDETPYRGNGAWIDVFDYAPAYQGGGASPAVTPDAIAEMEASGVHTIFVQAARADARSPQGLVDRALLARLLVRAHRRDIAVVGWYLPTFADPDADLANALAIDRFEVLGHRFDGLALDIEYTGAVPDHEARNASLLRLSTDLRAAVGDDALGAIVLPPVQTEVVNAELWPQFPWRSLASLYDVWLPMSYWTFRAADSGYHDGYRYNEESTRRLRANLGEPGAAVHAIGGIGDGVSADDLDRFVDSLIDTAAIGGSIYDWDTLTDSLRAHFGASFSSGAAASLAPR